jgi:hypothetical protein
VPDVRLGPAATIVVGSASASQTLRPAQVLSAVNRASSSSGSSSGSPGTATSTLSGTTTVALVPVSVGVTQFE